MKRVIGSIVLGIVLCLLGDLVTADTAHAQIKIEYGTYGQNCAGNEVYGNWTDDLKAACDGRASCEFDLRSSYSPGNDPCMGTKKTFIADYSCSPSTTLLQRTLKAEALGQTLTLKCQTVANRPPNAPTLLTPGNGWTPAINPRPIRFAWRSNGDPDGDAVAFALDIARWNASTRQWEWWVVNHHVNGMKEAGNGRAGSFYAWRVRVTDKPANGSPLTTFSQWSYFATQ
jgi:hypothetical protein